MPDRQQTSLKFPLEETVWFEKGHEVEDLLSISLDPNINIMDEEEFVVLKGTLELSGEYNHSPGNDTVTEVPESNRHYIQNVEIRNDKIGEFSHRFPVDITIPKKRIADIGELEIEIYSFDYALPENNRLQVLADIYINGIYEDKEEVILDGASLQEANESIESLSGEQDRQELNQVEPDTTFAEEESDQNEEKEEVAIEFFQAQTDADRLNSASENEKDLYESFEVEARILPELEEKNDEKEEELSPFQHHLPNLIDNKEEATDPKQVIEVKAEGEDLESLEPSGLTETDARAELETTEDQQEEQEEEQGREEEKSPSTLIQQAPKLTLDTIKEESSVREEESRDPESSSIYFHESSSHEAESSSLIESKEEKNDKKKKKDKYQSISFADFFARKEEESVSKMRVRLVQQGDSIENLADRYNVTTQQLLRANQLGESDEVYEGQVLYIPTKIHPLKRK
ncbi:LysM peptidoglycan-binding domain-containing protein [Lederbergia ruris]|uniref:LysM domain-containing protein n=1 Tax=Lederbergia ruris TaxID=217495 RepID=A0ABQ4KF56_9BACI|nr:LysM peptidoglycan-binding domain-containing protein [Lederbergia ruris]GIN55937.1 hypothetical protein J8TS2_02560 [Lederbergia ruris]